MNPGMDSPAMPSGARATAVASAGLGRVFVAIDLETTGLDAGRDTIIEIGAVRFQDGVVLDRFETLVNPRRPIPPKITQITGIDDADVEDAPIFREVAPELLAFVGSDASGLVAHNAAFDLGFLRTHGVDFHRPAFDTLELAALLLPRQASYSLGELSHHLHIPLLEAHRALDDAEATAHLFIALLARLDDLPAEVLETLLASGGETEWPPLLLFEDALRTHHKDSGTTLSGQARDWSLASAAGAAVAGREQWHALGTDDDEGDAVLAPVPDESIVAAFSSTGALGRLMGDGYEQRTGQVEMARRVADAFNRGDHLMVEAGTGTGKSLAYLLPAAMWAVANNRRVVIATNTIALQDQLLDKEIPQVQAILGESGAPEMGAEPEQGVDAGGAASILPRGPSIVRGALLKGRRNYLCLRRLEEWRSGRRLSPQELSVLARVLVWLPTTTTGDMAELALPTPADREIWQQICSDSTTCSDARCGVHAGAARLDFYALAQQRAESAHLLVVNHSLLFADIAADRNVLPAYDHLIIDEAHHLEEAATDQMTWTIEFGWAQSWLRRLCTEGDLAVDLYATARRMHGSLAGGLASTLGIHAKASMEALRVFHNVLLNFATHHIANRGEGSYVQRQIIDGTTRSQPMWSEVEIEWDGAATTLKRAVESGSTLLRQLEAERWDEQEANRTLLGELRTLQTDLSDLVAHLDEIVFTPYDGAQGGRICWMELNEGRNQVVLSAAPLQVSEVIQKELIHRLRTVILTGATLRTGATFRFIREQLGLWDVPTAIVDSPFDYRNAVLLYLPSDLAPPNSPPYQPGIEQAVVQAAEACKGRTLVLFTSNSHLRTTADAVRTPLARMGVALLQQGSTSRHRLLRDFRAADQAVLMGTRTYWEGIDLPGDELRCLIIAKLPFAVPNDPLVAARSAEYENSFAEYMVPDAVLRFRQGFGRLIRRASDRGVVVVLDSRVWRKEYGQVFLDALPPCTVKNAPLSILGSEVEKWLKRS